MNIQLVVFDMAGTTVAEGGAVYQAVRETLRREGIDVSDDRLHEIKGRDKREALEMLIRSSPQAPMLLPQMDRIHGDFVERLMAYYQNQPDVSEVPGTTSVWRTLRAAGCRIAMNTGFSRPIAQLLIDRMGWERAGLIDGSITSDEVDRGRPHPDMIHSLMRRLRVQDPMHVAKVGDAPSDLWEGKNAQCGRVIGVTFGASTRQQLEVVPHDVIIDSMLELPEALGISIPAC